MKIIAGTLFLIYGTLSPFDPTAIVLGLAFCVSALRPARA